MSSTKGILATTALIILMPLISIAQGKSGFQQDKQKFTTFGTRLTDRKFDGTGPAFSLSIDRFLNLEKVVRQDLSFMNVPNDSDWNDSARVIANYYFGTEAWVPLVGLSMGYMEDENKIDRLVAGPEIGFKYFMNQRTFLYGLLEYQFLFKDIIDVGDIYDNGQFVYGVGLGLTFSY